MGVYWRNLAIGLVIALLIIGVYALAVGIGNSVGNGLTEWNVQ